MDFIMMITIFFRNNIAFKIAQKMGFQGIELGKPKKGIKEHV